MGGSWQVGKEDRPYGSYDVTALKVCGTEG